MQLRSSVVVLVPGRVLQKGDHGLGSCLQGGKGGQAQRICSEWSDWARKESGREEWEFPHLQQRVSCYNLQKALEPFPSALDDLVREAIRKDLARQGWDVDSRTFALENVSEGLKVRAVAKIAR